ncbi:Mov34/MPN/PAD-1 family protein [Halobacillus massiliensis]|uniref:Mov34/MPN/PAD-1 family protein n=1 Tax=Halobacillus massiliensis TaxID=1926286 RepID=UPI0009E30718|nr:M67 family metallopeptidase [Halobacillus massiliensis]
MNQLVMSPDLYNRLIEYGSQELPYESCGLLCGNGNKVSSIFHLGNEIKSTHRFYISPSTLESSLAQIGKRDETVLAIYHTHPTSSPTPSREDVKSHVDPEIKMVIISFKKEPPEVSCFQIYEHGYISFPLDIKTL